MEMYVLPPFIPFTSIIINIKNINYYSKCLVLEKNIQYLQEIKLTNIVMKNRVILFYSLSDDSFELSFVNNSLTSLSILKAIV